MNKQKHTYDMGLIGNCAFLAHIGSDTNVKWLCWPRFDSDFVFGSLLDESNGGEFSILSEDSQTECNQYYLENTNILVTDITTEEGSYRVTDFAPRFEQNDRYYKPLMLIRKIEPVGGSPKVAVRCHPVRDRGTVKEKARQGSNHISFLGYEQELRLTTDIALNNIINEKTFVLDQTKYLILTYGPPLSASIAITAEDFLYKTIRYWRGWVKSTSIGNFYQAEVIRSALALKIHQYEDTGGIIASASCSLPESPGSTRNWDYRYCWMRDTYYTLNAFNNIGHFEELEKYFRYIINLPQDSKGRYQPLYGIGGEAQLTEVILDLQGYKGNKPVRFGNQAFTHIQNDVYGQILVSLLPLFTDNRFVALRAQYASTPIVDALLDKIAETMHEADAGLWEFRTKAQQHSYTFLFHWAGSKAAMKIARARGDQQMYEKAESLSKEAASKIEACYSKDKQAYAQALGTDHMDASTLQLISMHYLDPDSDRAKAHLQQLEKELKTPHGLFYRYKHADDFGEPETTFLICAFWYVEALACVGRIDDAIKGFEKLIGYSNHLGLLSEDIDEKSGSMWGNFPQAYSHVGLMNAAYRISRKLDLPAFM